MFSGKSIAYTKLTNIEKQPLMLFMNGNFDRVINILTIFKDYWTIGCHTGCPNFCKTFSWIYLD